MSKRHESRRTWRHGPRFQVSGSRDGAWWVWDNAAGDFVAGPFTSAVRATEEVRSRNEKAGFGSVANRPRVPPAPAARPTDAPPAEPLGRAIELALLRAAPAGSAGWSASVVVRRPKRRGHIPPPGTKVIISGSGSGSAEALVMSANVGGAGEVVLQLGAVDPSDIPSAGTLTWWS